MKFVFSLLALSLALTACQQSEGETNRLTRKYAKKGEKMTPTADHVVQANPGPGEPNPLSTKVPAPTN